MAPVRIALLLCDTPIESVRAQRGTYHDIFHALLAKSLPPHFKPEDAFVLKSYDVVEAMEYPEERREEEYDVLMLTGSAASAYENKEWINKLVDYVASVVQTKPHVKIIGICFGHQIVARALGGECVPNGGNWEIAITEVALTPLGQAIFGAPTINIQQMHRDHVPALPSTPNLYLLGSTPIAPNQGMALLSSSPSSIAAPSPDDIRVITVQGHPEFDQFIVDTVVAARESTGVVSKDVAEGARSRSGLRNDGVEVIGRVFWRIMGVT